MITDESSIRDRERRQRRNLRRSLRRQVEAAEGRLIEARQVLAAELDRKRGEELRQTIDACEQSIAEIRELLETTRFTPSLPQKENQS